MSGIKVKEIVTKFKQQGLFLRPDAFNFLKTMLGPLSKKDSKDKLLKIIDCVRIIIQNLEGTQDSQFITRELLEKSLKLLPSQTKVKMDEESTGTFNFDNLSSQINQMKEESTVYRLNSTVYNKLYNHLVVVSNFGEKSLISLYNFPLK